MNEKLQSKLDALVAYLDKTDYDYRINNPKEDRISVSISIPKGSKFSYFKGKTVIYVYIFDDVVFFDTMVLPIKDEHVEKAKIAAAKVNEGFRNLYGYYKISCRDLPDEIKDLNNMIEFKGRLLCIDMQPTSETFEVFIKKMLHYVYKTTLIIIAKNLMESSDNIDKLIEERYALIYGNEAASKHEANEENQ